MKKILLLIPFLAFANSDYPTSWWAEFPRTTAASWEILPQDAKPGEVILSKRTELGVFSNFAETPIVFDGVRYKSLEGFWQMMKYPEGPNDPRAQCSACIWPHTREQVSQMVGFEAKRAGDIGSDNMKKMGINYVTYQGQELPYRISEKCEHYKIIRRAMVEKLNQNPELKILLLKTKGLTLRPDHFQDNVPPAWRYAEIYMELRDGI